MGQFFLAETGQKFLAPTYAVAQFNLAFLYRGGHGVEKDEKESVRLCRLAAAQGHSGALFHLGSRYRMGEGVEKNPSEAVRLYHLSAKQCRFSTPSKLLSYCYENGLGVIKDVNEASFWDRAAKQKLGHSSDLRGLSLHW